MGVRHSFVCPKPDGGDVTVVRPSNWNGDHLAPPFVIPLTNASVTLSNHAAALAEMPGNYRTKVDLTNVDQVRLVVCVGVAAAATGELRIQYSTDQAVWSDLTPALTGLNSTGAKVGAWTDIPVGAKADVFLRIWGRGDGVADPQFRLIQLQVR